MLIIFFHALFSGCAAWVDRIAFFLMADGLNRLVGRVEVESLDVAISDLSVTRRPHGRGNLQPLVASIRKCGLLEPLLIGPDGVLLSGYRRHEASIAVGLETVECVRIADVVEACSIVREHLLRVPCEGAVPMTVRERMDLAMSLHSLPKPDVDFSMDFTYDTHVAPAVGLSSRVYWRIRSTIGKSNESASEPGSDALRARKVLSLMLEAVDFEFAGWSSAKVVAHLHGLLRSGGEIPNSLDNIAPRVGRASFSHWAPLPEQPSDYIAGSGATSIRSCADIRRAVDALSGVCVGLSGVVEVGEMGKGDRDYLVRELKTCKRVLIHMLKIMQGVSDV